MLRITLPPAQIVCGVEGVIVAGSHTPNETRFIKAKTAVNNIDRM